MRRGLVLGLVMVLPAISCQALGTSRLVGLLVALGSGLLAWVLHRSAAWAGGETGTGASTSAPEDTSGSSSGPEASDTTGSSTSEPTGTTTSDEAGETTETGPCLGAPYDGSTSEEPEMTVCLCACETDADGSGGAPLMLLPVVARRRSRRRSLERIAAEGRLPADVVARLRRAIPGDDEVQDDGSA